MTQEQKIIEIPTMDEADKLVQSTDYAIEAAEQELNPINWGDASAFFIEGCAYMKAAIVKALSLPTEGEIVDILWDHGTRFTYESEERVIREERITEAAKAIIDYLCDEGYLRESCKGIVKDPRMPLPEPPVKKEE